MPTQPLHSIQPLRPSLKRRMRWIVVAITVVALTIVFMALAQTPVQEQTFSTISIKGEPVSLVDYRGKVVMLNFWESW